MSGLFISSPTSFILTIIMEFRQVPIDRLNLQLGPIDEDFRNTRRHPGISRQTIGMCRSTYDKACCCVAD